MHWTAVFPALAALAGAALIPAAAAAAGGYHVEYAFQGSPADGQGPRAALMDFGGPFYGSTGAGGRDSHGILSRGILYRFDPTSGAETVLYSFRTKFSNGSPSDGRLVRVGDKLYGVTPGGGANGFGAVYRLYPQTGGVKLIYSFQSGADGAYPRGGLTNFGGQLYGTTTQGGSANCSGGCGTVFRVDPKSGAETVVHTFTYYNDTSYPGSTLTEVGGILYGTSAEGNGAICDDQPCGVLFAVDPASGTESVVYAFTGLANGDGWYPGPDLINVGGILYGVTERGGVSCAEVDYGCGTVFSFDPASGAETVLYAFTGGADGLDPKGGLAEVRGLFYGTTEAGGRQLGTIFSFDPVSSVKTVMHAFRGGADGAIPQAGLFYSGHQLYGTTEEGGGGAACPQIGCGTVFAFKP